MSLLDIFQRIFSHNSGTYFKFNLTFFSQTWSAKYLKIKHLFQLN